MSDSDKADRNTCVCQKSRRRCFVLSPNIKEFLKFSICTKLETGKSLLLIWGML